MTETKTPYGTIYRDGDREWMNGTSTQLGAAKLWELQVQRGDARAVEQAAQIETGVPDELRRALEFLWYCRDTGTSGLSAKEIARRDREEAVKGKYPADLIERARRLMEAKYV